MTTLAQVIHQARKSIRAHIAQSLAKGENPADLRNAGSCTMTELAEFEAEMHAADSDALAYAEDPIVYLDHLAASAPARWAGFVQWTREQYVAGLVAWHEAQARAAVEAELGAEEAAAKETLTETWQMRHNLLANA